MANQEETFENIARKETTEDNRLSNISSIDLLSESNKVPNNDGRQHGGRSCLPALDIIGGCVPSPSLRETNPLPVLIGGHGDTGPSVQNENSETELLKLIRQPRLEDQPSIEMGPIKVSDELPRPIGRDPNPSGPDQNEPIRILPNVSPSDQNELTPPRIQIEPVINNPVAPIDGARVWDSIRSINSLEKMAADAIIKDNNIDMLAKFIAMGGDPKQLVDSVNKELEKAGSKLRVKADLSTTLVCGDPKTQGSYARVDISLVGADGKILKSATPIDEMKTHKNNNGRSDLTGEIFSGPDFRKDILKDPRFQGRC